MSSATQIEGLMVPEAAEYLEQKAVADGVFAVVFGLLTHLAPVPPVTGSALVTKVLTQDIESLTGGKVLVELDPAKAADAIETHILAKRRGLGLEAGIAQADGEKI